MGTHKTRHIIKTNNAASVWCIWCSSAMSLLAEMQVHMEPFWNDSKLEGHQEDAEEDNMWLSPDTAVLITTQNSNVFPKTRAMMFLCASTATEPWAGRAFHLKACLIPFNTPGYSSAVSGNLPHAIEVTEKKENSALAFTQRASAWPSCSSSTEASSHPSWGNLFFFCKWELG